MIPFISDSDKLVYFFLILDIIIRGYQSDYLFKEPDELFFLNSVKYKLYSLFQC